jgi:segregation and condensation protein B
MQSPNNLQDLKLILETALLTSSEPLSINELKRLFEEELSPEILRKVLDELRQDWDGRGVELVNVASGWRFQTKPEFQKFIDRLNPEKPPRLSRAVLETLAIIAYRQPITRVEVEYLRGVDSGSVLKTLLDKHLVRILGKKDVPGKPAIYGTTREFLELFGLPDLAALPTLKEFSELVADADNDEGAAFIVGEPAGD